LRICSNFLISAFFVFRTSRSGPLSQFFISTSSYVVGNTRRIIVLRYSYCLKPIQILSGVGSDTRIYSSLPRVHIFSFCDGRTNFWIFINVAFPFSALARNHIFLELTENVFFISPYGQWIILIYVFGDIIFDSRDIRSIQLCNSLNVILKFSLGIWRHTFVFNIGSSSFKGLLESLIWFPNLMNLWWIHNQRLSLRISGVKNVIIVEIALTGRVEDESIRFLTGNFFSFWDCCNTRIHLII
jgi:hypothetical protein